ncbi:MAG: hypothetical protein AABW48_06145 [Nanoarchaeota archaeon]
MEKIWFSVDGYTSRLKVPVYDFNQSIRDEEIAKTQQLLSNPKNDQQRIVLYVITDDSVRKMAFIIDSNKRQALPSYESANPKSIDEQKQKTVGFLAHHDRNGIKTDATTNLAFYKPTSTEEELSLEAKIKELEHGKKE